MASNTPKSLRNLVIYQVWIRNHGEHGTFKGVQSDLHRIKELGADVVWLMPVQPIGEINRKGGLGSPYAIQDFRGINPEFGTLEDFKELVSAIHELGMKAMLDIVFNHTSPDSILREKHPEYFYKTPEGDYGNRLGEWMDVIDLDYSNLGLWDEQIDVLKYWVGLGIDGFRCDVAPIVPIPFWTKAREEIAKIKEDVIWLAESGHPGTVEGIRNMGIDYVSDGENYVAFDITYEYDSYPHLINYLEGRASLHDYLERIRIQEGIYPENYVKLRFIENHDKPRAKALIHHESDLRMHMAFNSFLKGPMLIYAGQEAKAEHAPSLFDTDTINITDLDEGFIEFYKALTSIKKHKALAQGLYRIRDVSLCGVVFTTYEYEDSLVAGVFNIEQKCGEVELGLKDGTYKNLIDRTDVVIADGKLKLSGKPVIFEIASVTQPTIEKDFYV